MLNQSPQKLLSHSTTANSAIRKFVINNLHGQRVDVPQRGMFIESILYQQIGK